MFTVQRSFYNYTTLADFNALNAYLGAVSQAGDVILYRFTSHIYATVNAANNAATLATS